MTITQGCEASAVAPLTTCGVCGFDGDRLSPPDAIVAIKSYPRRYRVLLAPIGDDDADEILGGRTTGASALDLTDHVAAALAQAAANLRDVTTVADATLDEPAPVGRAEGGGRGDVIARIDLAAAALADAADATKGDAWLRAGSRGGAPFSAEDVLRGAVHEGAHHLRDVEAAIAAALANRPGRAG